MFLYNWLTGRNSGSAPQEVRQLAPQPLSNDTEDHMADIVIIADEALKKQPEKWVKGPIGDAIRHVKNKDESNLPSLKKLTPKQAQELGITIPSPSNPQGGIAAGRVHHPKRHKNKPVVLQQP